MRSNGVRASIVGLALFAGQRVAFSCVIMNGHTCDTTFGNPTCVYSTNPYAQCKYQASECGCKDKVPVFCDPYDPCNEW